MNVPLQNIKLEIAKSTTASRVPATTAMKNQLRNRRPDLDSPSMCNGRSSWSME
jgi:hypothetical protein